MLRRVIFFYFAITFNLYSFNIQNELFLPSRFYVGDEVEYKIFLSFDKNEEFSFKRDLTFINNELFEIKNITYNALNNQLSIFFVSYYVGSMTLPKIAIGTLKRGGSLTTLFLEDLKINTLSLTNSQEFAKLKEINAILFLPGTSTTIFLILIVSFTLPFLLIRLFSFLKLSFSYFVKKHKLKKPYKRLQKQFILLEKNIKKSRDFDFYSFLNQIIRTYLSGKLEYNLSALTTKELAFTLSDFNVDYSLRASLIATLTEIDFNKFSGIELSLNEREKIIKDLREILDKFEDLTNQL